MRSVSTTGCLRIASFEGCRLKAYQCAAKVWTIGFGNTMIHGRPVQEGDVITRDEADAMLAKTIQHFAAGVDRAVTVEVTQDQFDVLVSLAYNIGIGGFRRSEVLQEVNAGNDEAAALAFMNHVRARGKVLRGLVRRRCMEAIVYAAPLINGDQVIARITAKARELQA